MTAVLAHTHYLPVSWRGQAHTSRVRDQFGHFFQLRAMYLINELLSPITTPFILMFYLRPRSLDIVDFFRNFTVSVVGVGDVCSFAQMDVRKHGNPDWQPTHSTNADVPEVLKPLCETNQYTQGEHGKTELVCVLVFKRFLYRKSNFLISSHWFILQWQILDGKCQQTLNNLFIALNDMLCMILIELELERTPQWKRVYFRLEVWAERWVDFFFQNFI